MQANYVLPLAVSDLNVWKLFDKKDENIYCMGSLERDKYIQLNESSLEAVKWAVAYFDGSHTLQEIKDLLMTEKGINLNVEQLYDYLCKADLISNVNDKTLVEKQEMDYLSITLKEFNLKPLYPLFRFVNKYLLKYLLAVSTLIIVISIGFFITNINTFIRGSNYLIANSYEMSFLTTLAIFVLSIGIHEFAHSIAGYYYGLKPAKMVIALYMLTPMFYLKIPGIYTIKAKQRVIVWSAGVYINLLIASVCVIIATFAENELKAFLLLTAITNLSLILANLSPLLPLDGYFIVSTLLKRPNLRKGSYKEFKKWALGKENNFRGLSILYFTLSTSFIVGIIALQVRWAVVQVINGIQLNYSVFEILYQFQLIFLIIGIMLVKKVLEIIMKHIARRKKLNQH